MSTWSTVRSQHDHARLERLARGTLLALATLTFLAATGCEPPQPAPTSGQASPGGAPQVSKQVRALSGSKPYIVVLCKYPDQAVTAEDNAYYRSLIDNVNAFWTENSYGAVTLAGSQVTPTCQTAGCQAWHDLPQNLAAYKNPDGGLNLGKFTDDCLGTVDAQLDFNQFYGAVMIPNVSVGSNFGADNGALNIPRDGRTSMPQAWMSSHGFHETAHEVGHTLGLPHLVPYPAGCVAEGYQWDVMASAPRHTNIFHKDSLGWIPANRRWQPSVAGTTTIHLERTALPPNNPGTYLMAKVPVASVPGTFWAVEARRRAGFDTDLPSEGVRIYHADTSRGERSWVVDPDGDSDVNEDDSIFVPGETFRDPYGSTTITVLAQTADGYDVSVTYDPAPCCGGDGLRATYFANPDFSGASVSRVEGAMNFDWGVGSPDPAIPVDNFSARWVGELLPPTSGLYTFYSTPDDGVRVWVDGKLVIDSWIVQANAEHVGRIALTAGRRTSVVMEYFEAAGFALANLSWSGPNVPKTFIPRSRLFSALATPACLTASSSGPWLNTAFASQNKVFTAEFDATPGARPLDAVVGLSAGAQTAFTGLAAAVRFNTAGNIDARNGGTYAALTTIAYSANQTYHFRLAVDLTTKRYSIWLRRPGQGEEVLGRDFAFRTEQSGVTQLNNRAVKVNASPAGSLQVCNFALTTSQLVPVCKTGAAGAAWVNTAFPAQSGVFAVEYDGRATADPIDGSVALSRGAQTSFTGFAAITRFNPSGLMDARNGSSYSSWGDQPYDANVRYHFRWVVNVPAKKYCVYYTPPMDGERTLAGDLGFRTEQLGVTALDNWGVKTNGTTGATEACDFASFTITP
jgi:M6 family metalloprotease-like protein